MILSIHQPRYSIFKLFNTLTLLSRGQVVFHGPAKEAMPYFDKIGEFEFPYIFLTLLQINGSINSSTLSNEMDMGYFKQF